MARAELASKLRPHYRSGVAGLLAVGLMLTWAVDDGGFDATTWYWGALVTLGLLGVVLISLGDVHRGIPRPARIALVAFGLYVVWSYLSISWAQYPGAALEGSNRALMYLLLFALLAVLPWTMEAALAALMVFALGIGVIAVVLILHLASGNRIDGLFVVGRLAAPTGYGNATAALFMIGTLTAIALAARRQLPGPLRGLLMTAACADLQLALIVQSRGWFFTLPLVILVAVLVAAERLRVAAAAVLPAVGTALVLRRLLDVYHIHGGASLDHAAIRAGHAGVLACLGVFFVGTLAAWLEQIRDRPPLPRMPRRLLGTGLAVIAIGVAGTVAMAVSNGHPLRYLSTEWHGFSHDQANFYSGNHFADVGSGRYDVWRVSLDAFLAHPVGGLGQDNFGDYYLPRRRATEEPSWTHSLEMRLLAHTGIVGFVLFVVFLIAALVAARRARRSDDPLVGSVASAALMPLVVWLIHGSLDWFWEIPALSAPALGFLAMAGRLTVRAPVDALGGAAAVASEHAEPALRRDPRAPGALVAVVAGLALLAATAVLGFPYLAARDLAHATSVGRNDPGAAFSLLQRSHQLNPLSSDPGVVAGTIALQLGRTADARRWFQQATAKEPGSWYAWLGAGLVASAQGNTGLARADYTRARRINSGQPAIQQALATVGAADPLTAQQALSKLVFAP